jgi:uncharacterized protein (TIGR03905 family)
MQNNKEKYTEKIKRYLHAGIPILYIESFEENRIYQILLDAIRDWNYSIIEYNSRGIFCDGSKEKDNKVVNIKFIGGCPGNTQGVAALCKGMDINEVIARLEGIKCGFKPTSCPDQLAQALKTISK